MSDRSLPWAICWDEHVPALILLARQWSDCHADAEDIVQEAFLHFWAKRDSVREPVAYLYACVRRAAMDRFRQKHRRQEQTSAGIGAAEEPWFETDGFCPEEQEGRAEIERALGKLSLDQRQVVVMKIWGGLTFAAIGEVLAISANTAASRYRLALAALRIHLHQDVI
jgi:RNA polymerase sigma-70 factor (ECF subfamily)